MKKSVLKISLLCFLSIVSIGKSFGQAAANDSSYLQASAAQTVANFYKTIGQQSRLYNGHEYLPYDRNIHGTALYPNEVKSWEPGEVNYDGIVYRNVPMMYDIYKDVVVVLLFNKFSMYILQNNKVHDFTFVNHHFIRVVADSLNNGNSGLATGFYDQIYGGKIEILARREKGIQNSSSSAIAIETFFVAHNTYYLRKGNTYYKVGSKNSILNLLKDKKAALQQYLKDNNIDFGDNPEYAMAKIASYYDHLTN